MALRAGSDEWRDLIDDDADITGSPFHLVANALTDKVASNDTLGLMTTDLLLHLEKWLAAGYYALRDPLLSDEKAGEAAGRYEIGEQGLGPFEANRYLKMAMGIDVTGYLAQLNSQAKLGGSLEVGMTWLGLPESGQTDYTDRD